MDTPTLVTTKMIDDGRNLIRQLIANHVDVTVAAWVRLSLNGKWQLYIVTKLVDDKGFGEAYIATQAAKELLPDPWNWMWEIKTIGVTNPVGRDILAARAQSPEDRLTHFLGQQLGGVPIDDAYIYPSTALSFEVIAKGKDEVLRYLEQEACSRSGSPGEYLLGRDDRGNLVAFIAGHSFLGAGTISVENNRLIVVDGIVTDIRSGNGVTNPAPVASMSPSHGTAGAPC